MKYTEPDLQIVLTVEEDIVRTSSVIYDPNKFPEDSGKFPIKGN